MTGLELTAKGDLGAMSNAHARRKLLVMDLDAAMKTMTVDPYVVHVPTMTGGIGSSDVRAFYANHLIGHWPDDMEATSVSRTIGTNQVVDELVISFTHTCEVPIMFHGIKPTGRKIVLPHVFITGFEDGLVAYEHVYWDQASALLQAGLIEPEAGVPMVGSEQARALLDHAASRGELAPGTNTGHDLAALFDRHVSLEFQEKDVAATMETMNEHPYVWSVPVAFGGDDHDGVTEFYTEKFVGHMPADTAVSRISRTVGADQVVDEMILTFTHDSPVEFALPGVAPTGRKVEMPHVVVMGFEGGKVTHEHIYWDHGSLLVQVGLLEPANRRILGVEPSRWLRDRTEPLNDMLKN